ncbi:MAG: putative trehalose phosphatase [Phycisphaerae bacterium]|nr:MAG: putative trehalose phosphatase [Phycisphaerae bacterium]
MSLVPPDVIDRLAAASILLIACDFDGTLAEIVDHPDDAEACARASGLLRTLAHQERTYAAVLSGRSLADLRARFADHAGITLIGGHGAEPEYASWPDTHGQRARHVTDALRPLADEFPGVYIEFKPAGPALHYRHVPLPSHATLLERVQTLASSLGIGPLRHGLFVVEFPVLPGDKGHALTALTHRLGAAAVLFLGDDRTDEDAFVTLQPPSVGVKVGPGPTAAGYRVRSVADVGELLERILAARQRGIEPRVPIDHHALLSDQRALALVDCAGRVVWLSSPRADSPPLFASLLGGPRAGVFEVVPAEGGPGLGAYEPNTFIATTRFPTMTLTDYLDCSGGRAFQRAGRSDLLRVLHGSGRVRLTFAPRIDFGRSPTRLRIVEHGLVVEGSADPIGLHAPGIAWTLEHDGPHHTARAEIDLPPEGLTLHLRLGSASTLPSTTPEPERRRATGSFWAGWASTLRLPPIHAELVRRSALVIKSLCYGPTGAILAAATTSLPEQLGGTRNWDYRFCWVRDAAMAAASLVRLGSTGHAMKYLDWLLAVVDDLPSPERLRPIYTIKGDELGPEGEVSEVAGYAVSRPVRVGNGAGHQVQLDVFGPVADLIARMAEAGAPLTPDHLRLLDAMVTAVAARWREPDHGIWEVRGPMRHHVHSKALCWHAVDRAIAARAALGEPARDAETRLREEIREEVLRLGYNTRVGAFTAAYGADDLDAACLLVGLTGLIPPKDPRFIATVHHVRSRLMVGEHADAGVVRYVYDDGLPGSEGVFHLCTGWLVESLALIGEHDHARTLFEDYAAQVGPWGLYSEERDPLRREALGNFPQAYSHLALINAAVRLADVAP